MAINKFWMKFFGWLMSLLGIGAAAGSCNIIDGPFEYGCPHSDYKISGKVTDAVTGSPISGIRIERYHGASSCLDHTGTDGSFSVSFSDYPKDTLNLHFIDEDGVKNGSYKDAKVLVSSFQKTKKGDGRWYDGVFEATSVTAQMEPEAE